MSVLSDIITSISQSQYFQKLIAAHKANGVPVGSWLSLTNTGLSLTQILSAGLADLRQMITTMAQAMLLDYASGPGLTLLAKSQYQLDRIPAQFTVGKILLKSASTAPAYSFIPGQITVGTPGPATSQTQLFVNVDSGSLSPGGILLLTFQAIQPGSGANLLTGTPLDLKTSFVGVTVTNPIYKDGTWITQQGAPEETDDSLKLRCISRWGTLGAGGNEAAFEFWARQIPPGYVSSPVLRVRVASNLYQGQYVPGCATVFIAGTLGSLPASDVAAVQQNFDQPPKYPVGCFVEVATVKNRRISLVGTVNISRSANVSVAEVQAAVSAGMAAYQGTLDIGQTLYPQKLGAEVDEAYPIAIRDVELISPVDPVFLKYAEYPLLDITKLTYQVVD